MYKDKKYIESFVKTKLGSTKDNIFTFRVFDAESKTEFANNSLNSPKKGNCFRVGIRAQVGLDSLKNPMQTKNLMLLSL